MKDKIKRLLYSDRFVIIIGLIVVPLISFMLIATGEESPLYTSISRIAWIHGRWLSTFMWALAVMSAIIWITYRMVSIGPLAERVKRIYLGIQTLNIILVFIGCTIFPAKGSIDTVVFVNYVHDYLTISAWALYGIGLLFYSVMLRGYDRDLSFIGIGLMSFIILSSSFFISRVIDPTSYVGASAVSEVYIINSLLIYLVVMYLLERIKLNLAHSDITE